MKLLEVFKSKDSKFFARNSICRSIKSGYVYVDDNKVWVPSETKLTIEYFNLYNNRAVVLIDGRQRAEVTYEYLMDCVVPINVDVSQTVTALQILQRVNNIVSNEAIVKIICAAMLFVVGLLLGKIF